MKGIYAFLLAALLCSSVGAQRFVSGVTDQYISFTAISSTDFTTRLTGLSTFTVRRSRNGGAEAGFTTPTVTEVDAADMPGKYKLLLDEDMTIDAGDDSQEFALYITHAGMVPVDLHFELYRPKITAGETVTAANGMAHGNTKAVNDDTNAAANQERAFDGRGYGVVGPRWTVASGGTVGPSGTVEVTGPPAAMSADSIIGATVCIRDNADPSNIFFAKVTDYTVGPPITISYEAPAAHGFIVGIGDHVDILPPGFQHQDRLKTDRLTFTDSNRVASDIQTQNDAPLQLHSPSDPVPASIYAAGDTLFDATALGNIRNTWNGTGYAGGTVKWQTDVRQFGGSNGMFAGGIPNVNAYQAGGSTVPITNFVTAFNGGSYNVGGGGINVNQAQTVLNAAVGSFTAAALDSLVLSDTGETAAAAGSVAKLSQGAADPAAIWSHATRTITAAPAWNAAWDAEVQSEVQDAVEANHLDHLLAADYDPSNKPGVATALFNELVGNDAGVSQFTLNTLELAPTGGGNLLTIEGTDATDALDARIAAYGALKPTVAARTLDVTATGAAGIDWANVENPAAALALDNTTIESTGSAGDVETIEGTDATDVLDARLLAYGALKPTVAGRLLDVTATGAAGIDWGNVENPATSQNLAATTIQGGGGITWSDLMADHDDVAGSFGEGFSLIKTRTLLALPASGPGAGIGLSTKQNLDTLDIEGVLDWTETERSQILAALSVGEDIGVPAALIWTIARIDGEMKARSPISIDAGEANLEVAADFRGVLASGDAISAITAIDLIDDSGAETVTSTAFGNPGNAEIWMNAAVKFRITAGTAGDDDRIRIRVTTVGGSTLSAPCTVKTRGGP